MVKPTTTRTLGPLHFEDLDPHRFEDLVRELAYEYKEWQSIEATGRSGSDQGWDIRAYERLRLIETEPDPEDEPGEEAHPMDGNVWMFQVKREKALGPSDVKRILSDVEPSAPPYGYILAAPTSFSKRSYDVFRTELRAKGVVEFYLWGRAELEDMLHMPKNDRILFTFFGISLTTRRRSRSTEVKSVISVKNKLYRILGEGSDLHRTVLLRDLADSHYPYASKYPDFESSPRWRQRDASGHHPLGLWLHVHRYYAYVDRVRKEFDFTNAFDLCDDEHSERQSEEVREAARRKQQAVLDEWGFLPQSRQGVFVVDGLVKYSSIAAIDEKGDVWYECPHVFVEFMDEEGPYQGWYEVLEVAGNKIPLTEDFKRVTVFPKVIQARPKPTAVAHSVSLDEQTMKDFYDYGDVGVMFSIDGRYKKLKAGDVVALEGGTPKFAQQALVQITYVGRATLGGYARESREPFKIRRAIRQQVGQDLADDHNISYVEYKRFYMPSAESEGPIMGASEE